MISLSLSLYLVLTFLFYTSNGASFLHLRERKFFRKVTRVPTVDNELSLATLPRTSAGEKQERGREGGGEKEEGEHIAYDLSLAMCRR